MSRGDLDVRMKGCLQLIKGLTAVVADRSAEIMASAHLVRTVKPALLMGRSTRRRSKARIEQGKGTWLAVSAARRPCDSKARMNWSWRARGET